LHQKSKLSNHKRRRRKRKGLEFGFLSKISNSNMNTNIKTDLTVQLRRLHNIVMDLTYLIKIKIHQGMFRICLPPQGTCRIFLLLLVSKPQIRMLSLLKIIKTQFKKFENFQSQIKNQSSNLQNNCNHL